MARKLRITSAVLVALLSLLSFSSALAEVTFVGKVIASETKVVSAPFGGLVDTVALRVGDPVQVGDAVATIATTKVYAPADGVVSGVFAKEGDDTEGIVTRYGAVMYIEPTSPYVISATTEKAYNSSSTKYIHIGEKVYLSCTKDGSHVGTAVVTSIGEVDESGNTPYKLEVTGGDFYMSETVGIFRSPKYDTSTRIGRGTVQQNAAIAIKGSGSVLKLHVKVGDSVERGELLFETVEGVLDGLYAMDNTIVSNISGVVATVDTAPGSAVTKGAKLIGVYPEDSFQIEINVSELDLTSIHEGDKVAIEFDWDADGLLRMYGTVASISLVNAEAKEGATGSGAEYSAYVNFAATKDIRLGMSVIVYIADEEAALDEPAEAVE